MKNLKELVFHSRNYLFADLASRAIGIVTIPIYTRLLSEPEFGSFNLYIGVAHLLSPLIALSLDRAISRFYYDAKNNEEFTSFVGTSIILSFFVALVSSLFILFNAKFFSSLVSLEPVYVVLLIPFSLIHSVGLIFKQIFNPMKESLLVSKFNVFKAYLSYFVSILFVINFFENKLFAAIIGLNLGLVPVFLGYLYYIKRYFKADLVVHHIKYIFSYSVPLIPYALSGLILGEFGKIVIGSTVGMEEVGYYSIALNLSNICMLVVGVTHQAWNPYYFEHMNSGDTLQLNKEYSLILWVTLLTITIVSLFSKEIGLILAPTSFQGSISLVPILAFGAFLYQISYIYLRNFGYAKKTYLLTLTVLITGAINILLNVILIPKYYDFGAALSYTFSYLVMIFLGYLVHQIFVDLYRPSLKLFKVPIIVSVIILVMSLFVNTYLTVFWVSFITKSIILILVLAFTWFTTKATLFQSVIKKINVD